MTKGLGRGLKCACIWAFGIAYWFSDGVSGGTHRKKALDFRNIAC